MHANRSRLSAMFCLIAFWVSVSHAREWTVEFDFDHPGKMPKGGITSTDDTGRDWSSIGDARGSRIVNNSGHDVFAIEITCNITDDVFSASSTGHTLFPKVWRNTAGTALRFGGRTTGIPAAIWSKVPKAGSGTFFGKVYFSIPPDPSPQEWKPIVDNIASDLAGGWGARLRTADAKIANQVAIYGANSDFDLFCLSTTEEKIFLFDAKALTLRAVNTQDLFLKPVNRISFRACKEGNSFVLWALDQPQAAISTDTLRAKMLPAMSVFGHAAIFSIDADQPKQWNPVTTVASKGDEIVWKNAAGSHGLHITNWNDAKAYLEIEHVEGQIPFNEQTGRNDQPTAAPGKVFLKAKIKDFPNGAIIQFNCTVHGSNMKGTVTLQESNGPLNSQ
jgi:hypothetical protein